MEADSSDFKLMLTMHEEQKGLNAVSTDLSGGYKQPEKRQGVYYAYIFKESMAKAVNNDNRAENIVNSFIRVMRSSGAEKTRSNTITQN